MAAEARATPIGAGAVSRQAQARKGNQQTCESFHCDSFARVIPKPCRPREANPILDAKRIHSAGLTALPCEIMRDAAFFSRPDAPHPAQIESAETPANSRKNSLSPRWFFQCILAIPARFDWLAVFDILFAAC